MMRNTDRQTGNAARVKLPLWCSTNKCIDIQVLQGKATDVSQQEIKTNQGQTR